MTAWLVPAATAGQPSPASDDPSVREGSYLARISGCADCHTSTFQRPMAGGVRLQTPFGEFFAPNITADPEFGIGAWTAADFRRALRAGVSPRGSVYYPVFPYRSYTKLVDSDVDALFAYLRSLPTDPEPARRHVLPFYLGRWQIRVWQEFFFRGRSSDLQENIKIGQGPFVPDPTRSEAWNRGAYLVEASLHCSECHTPRNAAGAVQLSHWMAGSDVPIGGLLPPNITSDPVSGLGRWTAVEWDQFLSGSGRVEGARGPHTVGGEMALVLQNTSALRPPDRASVIVYLMALPAVRTQGTQP